MKCLREFVKFNLRPNYTFAGSSLRVLGQSCSRCKKDTGNDISPSDYRQSDLKRQVTDTAYLQTS